MTDYYIRFQMLFLIGTVKGPSPTEDNVKLRHFPTNYVKLRPNYGIFRQITAFSDILTHFPTFYCISRHINQIFGSFGRRDFVRF